MFLKVTGLAHRPGVVLIEKVHKAYTLMICTNFVHLILVHYHMPVWNTLKSAFVLSPPSPERVLQDGLYYEFTRHSPGAVVRMYGKEGQDIPWAVVKFKTWVMCMKDCRGD